MGITSGFVDYDADLTEMEYAGVYNGIYTHRGDTKYVLRRAFRHGLEKIIISGKTPKQSRRALTDSEKDDRLYCTMAAQATSMDSWVSRTGSEKWRTKLYNMCTRYPKKVVGVGRIGLEYTKDRLFDCPKEIQLDFLNMHIETAIKVNLPIVLSCRSASDDMFELLAKYQGQLRGVIHNFCGTVQEAAKYRSLGMYIGLSGCSLKTKHHAEMVKALPLKYVLLGTNSPTCGIKHTYPGFEHIKSEFPAVNKANWTKYTMVKGRNEPAKIKQLIEAVAGIRNIKPELLTVLNKMNTESLFFPNKDNPAINEPLPPVT